MSVLNRISTILRANINDLLDRAEDPEKMLNQILRDMSQAIADAKSQIADALAQSKLVEADLTQARELAAQWERKALVAIDRGADDLARECLHRKRDYETNAQTYDQQVASFQPMIATLKREMALLESKRAETERSRSLLLARYKTARAQEQMQKSLGGISAYDPSGALVRMEERIKLKEARVAAVHELNGGSLEGRLASLEAASGDIEIEADLLELKARSGRLQLPPAAEPE